MGEEWSIHMHQESSSSGMTFAASAASTGLAPAPCRAGLGLAGLGAAFSNGVVNHSGRACTAESLPFAAQGLWF